MQSKGLLMNAIHLLRCEKSSARQDKCAMLIAFIAISDECKKAKVNYMCPGIDLGNERSVCTCRYYANIGLKFRLRIYKCFQAQLCFTILAQDHREYAIGLIDCGATEAGRRVQHTIATAMKHRRGVCRDTNTITGAICASPPEP